MNVIELVFWSAALWLVCWLTIDISQRTGVHVGLVSLGVIYGIVFAGWALSKLLGRSRPK